MANIAVVGTGGWGKNHLRILKELKALRALCDLEEQKVSLYAGKTISSGLHTFVEKPLTYSSQEGEKLMEMAREHRTILTAGYIERFNPAVTELKKILEERRMGEPILLEFHRENKWSGNVMDVGIIQDTSVHDIDTARWIFGAEPRIVFARVGKVISPNEDFAAIILGFDGQKTAFMATNWVTPKKVRQLIAVCTEGIVTIDFITQMVVIDNALGTNTPRTQWQEPLLLELRAFVDCVDKGGNPLVTPRDAVNTTKISEAALISSQTGSPIYLEL
jgi:UDP-N-acetylglucosamine 3-dehydrogenase